LALAILAYFFLPFLILLVLLWRPIAGFFKPSAEEDTWPEHEGPALDLIATLVGLQRKRTWIVFRERDVTLRRRIRNHWSDKKREGAWPQ
jgi:hypothetical protein